MAARPQGPLSNDVVLTIVVLQYLSSCATPSPGGLTLPAVSVREIADYYQISYAPLDALTASLGTLGYLSYTAGAAPGQSAAALSPSSWPSNSGLADRLRYFVWNAPAGGGGAKQPRVAPGQLSIVAAVYPVLDSVGFTATGPFSEAYSSYQEVLQKEAPPQSYPAEVQYPATWAVSTAFSATYNLRILGDYSAFLLLSFQNGINGTTFAQYMNAAPSAPNLLRFVLAPQDALCSALSPFVLWHYQGSALFGAFLLNRGSTSGTLLSGDSCTVTYSSATGLNTFQTGFGAATGRFLGVASSGALLFSAATLF